MGLKGFTSVEFGVASGRGLEDLAKISETVGRRLEIEIDVYGFDWGQGGLKETCDYRDHPEMWKSGEYAMESQESLVALFKKKNVSLIIGDIKNNINQLNSLRYPLGFVSVDVDYYNSTTPILDYFASCNIDNLLPAVAFYFDDTDTLFTLSKYTGQELAISEFNQKKLHRKLDKKSEKYRLHALNNFDHPLRNSSNQYRLDINHRTLIAIFDAKQF
jgi:hypothetical protein